MRMPRPLAVELAHLRGESHGAFLIQAEGHGEGFGMIGDGDVFVAALARGFGHFFERGAAVGLGGVHVHVAADLAQFDQFGQAAFGGGSISPQVFAQLRRNPGQAQRFVNACLGFAAPLGDRRPRGTGRTRSA